MKSARFSHDAEAFSPSRVATRADDAKDWLSLLLPLLAILGVLAGFGLLWQAMTMPVPMNASTSVLNSVSGSFATPPAATYPPEIVQAAIAISTFIAPTPTRTPMPYQTPTPPVPTIYCGINSDLGQTCTWPQPTIVATEMPICLTPIPASDCTWRGNVIATPLAGIPGAVNGS